MTSADEWIAKARVAAEARAVHELSPVALDALRVEAAELFEALPEPPSYRKTEDPARRRANELLPKAAELLTRVLLARRALRDEERVSLLSRAVEAHVRALAAIAAGEIGAGEDLSRDAWDAARAVTSSGSFFRVDKGTVRKVFDAASGESRYDPRPEPHLTVQLFCANEGCRQPASYQLAPRYATHRFLCVKCRKPFTGHFAEVRSAEARNTGRATHYTLRVLEVGGGEQTLEFDDASGGELLVAPRDLIALLYAGTGTLAAVENLSTGRVLWIVPKSACFIATAALGEHAPELETFREFRDEVLLPTSLGRGFVRLYYRASPPLARVVRRHPSLRTSVRTALLEVHRWLK